MRPTREEIADLLARFDSSPWDEMDLVIGDFRLRLSTDSTPAAPAAPPARTGAPPPMAAAPKAATGVRARAVVPAGAHTVKAPSLGRFWRKPKPSEPPFVELGATVAVGDVVCIVEVMKLFTQVKTEVAGKVTACPLTDGEMVEYDDVLFVIEPAGKA